MFWGSTISLVLTHVAWAEVLQGQISESCANPQAVWRLSISIWPLLFPFSPLSYYSLSALQKNKQPICISGFHGSVFYNSILYKKTHQGPPFFNWAAAEDGRGSLSDLQVDLPVSWKGLEISCPSLTLWSRLIRSVGSEDPRASLLALGLVLCMLTLPSQGSPQPFKRIASWWSEV